MIRNLRVLVLALVAVLALSALGASSASAVGKFTSAGGYPQHLVGTDVGTEDLFTVAGMSDIKCGAESFTAEISSESTEMTVAPDFTGCTTPSPPGEFTILMNGCDFRFSLTETVGKDHDKGTMALVCPTGKIMETWQFSGPTNHKSGTTNCKITTAPQNGTGALSFTSETGSKDILMHGSIGMIGQLHGQCSFGLTFSAETTFHFGVTFQSTSGVGIHVG